MNIQIRISIRAANYHDDGWMAETIENIVNYIRALFPEIHPNRKDSPVVVTITRDPEYEEEGGDTA